MKSKNLTPKQIKEIVYEMGKQNRGMMRALSKIILDIPTSSPAWRIANEAIKKSIAIDDKIHAKYFSK